MASDKSIIEMIFRGIDRVTAPLRNIDRQLGTTSNISGAVAQRLQRDFESADRAVASFGVGVTRVVKGLAVAGVAAFLSFGTVGVKNMLEVGTAMQKVSTIADTSAVSLKSLQAGLTSVSNVTGIAVTSLAESQYQAISAGIATAESVDFVALATKAAKGGFTDTTTAIDGLTSVLNSYGLAASDATMISDQMIIAQNLGKTTFGEMSASMGQVIPIASSLGVSTDELFASVAALTASGIGTSESMTGLKAALSNILKPSSQAADMAAALGIDFSAAALESQGFAKFLDTVAVAVDGDNAKMSQLFGSVEALNSIMVLTGTGADKFSGALDAMANSSGATESAFSKMMDDPVARFDIAKNKIVNAGTNMGTALLPVIEKITAKFSKFADWLLTVDWKPFTDAVGKALSGVESFIGWLWKFRDVIVKVAAVILAYKIVVLAVVLAVKSWTLVTKIATGISKAWTLVCKIATAVTRGDTIAKIASAVAIKAMTVANNIAAIAQGALNVVMGIGAAIMSPITLIVLAIVAAIVLLVVGIYQLTKNWDVVTAAMQSAWEWLKNIVSIIVDGVVGAFQSAGEWISKVANIVWDGLVGAFQSAWEWIQNVATVIKDVLLGALNAVWAPIQGIIDAFTGGGIIAGIRKIGATIFDFIMTPVKAILGLIAKIPGADWAVSALEGIDNLSYLISGETPESSEVTTPPITQRDATMYSREESLSRTEMTIGLEKGLTSNVSGSAPNGSLNIIHSGAF